MGKKKRHTLKVQLVISKKTKRILCTAHDKGKTHDFRVFTKSQLSLHEKVKVKADSGYQRMQQVHGNSGVPQKNSRRKPLTDKEKAANCKLAKERVVVEHVIGRIQSVQDTGRTLSQQKSKTYPTRQAHLWYIQLSTTLTYARGLIMAN